MSLPTQNEKPLCKCRVLYLGTTYFKQNKNDTNYKVNLNLIQNSIAARYPINGEKFAKGIETWLSIYPSGLQMEHSVAQDSGIDGIFLYPIRSLIYCAALRLSNLNRIEDWKFVPLDSEEAELSLNLKNPPIFAAVVRGAEPSSIGENIECHVFVVGMKKTAMRLVESCQRVYSQSRFNVNEFRDIYGSIPAVYTVNDGLDTSSLPVKKHDDNGFFYVLDDSSIDVWQLYETEPEFNNNLNIKIDDGEPIYTTSNDYYEGRGGRKFIDPYEDAPNLVKVERRVDPNTGQNIYVRWLAPPPSTQPVHIIEHVVRDESSPEPPILIREKEPSPQPIVVEKIVQKKKPQLIIKEIHVSEPPPPPIKVVKELETDSDDPIPPPKHPYKDLLRPPHVKYSRHRNYYDYNGHMPPPPPTRYTPQPPPPQYTHHHRHTRHHHHDQPPQPYPHDYHKRKPSQTPQPPTQRYPDPNVKQPKRTPSTHYNNGHLPPRYPTHMSPMPPPTPQYSHYHHDTRRHHHHQHNQHPQQQQQQSKNKNLSPYDLIDNIDKLINSPKNKEQTSKKYDEKGRKIYVIHDQNNLNNNKTQDSPRKHGRKIIVIDGVSSGDEEKIVKNISKENRVPSRPLNAQQQQTRYPSNNYNNLNYTNGHRPSVSFKPNMRSTFVQTLR